MGEVLEPQPVKLIVGFIFNQENAFIAAKGSLIRNFGEVDFESGKIAFAHTDYYQSELGENLKRKFISLKKLILPDELAQIKNITNKIEKKLSLKKRRTINIDPGYLDLAKLVLASTKDYTHRIYLTKGIYAEVTLFYQSKTFNYWPQTYPDYKSSEYIEIFNRIREIYRQQCIPRI